MKKGVPFHLITRRILNSTSMSEVFEFLEGIDRAGSANYLIGHTEGEIIDVEAGPNRLGYLYPNDGFLVHTNDFLSMNLEDVGRKRFPDSVVRYFRCQHLLRKDEGISVNNLQSILRDHFNYPYSICFHPDESKAPEEREQTNASFITDLTDQAMWVAKGPPARTGSRSSYWRKENRAFDCGSLRHLLKVHGNSIEALSCDKRETCCSKRAEKLL
jgi:isopenicillin-N N-acyltransferase-like protein